MSDVITVSAGTVGSAGNVAASLITYLTAKLLDVAELNCVMDQFGEKVPLPSNSSKTIRFVKEEKLTVATSPTQLTEGVPPDAVGITLNQFEATVEQYGALVRLSDLAELTAKHNIVERTIYMLGLQAAETYDQLIFNTLETGATSVYRPNGVTADTSLLATDKPAYIDLVELSALQQDAGAKPMDGVFYTTVMAPQVHACLQTDPDFKAAAQFQAPDKIWRGEVGALAGHRIVVTNAPAFAATAQTTTGKANKVYSSYVIGRNAYQISDLQNLQVYAVAPGGQSDPLQQSRKLGWKFAFKALVTNTAWIRRVRSAGMNSVAYSS